MLCFWLIVSWRRKLLLTTKYFERSRSILQDFNRLENPDFHAHSRSLAQSFKSFFRKWRELLTKISAEQQSLHYRRRLTESWGPKPERFGHHRIFDTLNLVWISEWILAAVPVPWINLFLNIKFSDGPSILEIECGMRAPVNSIIAANLKQIDDFLLSRNIYHPLLAIFLVT